MTLLLISLALAVGAVLGIGLARWQHDEAVQRWEAARDSALAERIAQDRHAENRERLIAALSQQVKDERARVRGLRQERAQLRTRRRLETPALPDTGMVPVAAVKTVVAAYQDELVRADSVIEAQDRIIAKYDTMLVIRTNDFVAERVARQRADHLLKTAPVRKERPKIFGVPLPRAQITCGVQAGASFSRQGYAGLGCTAGLGYAL